MIYYQKTMVAINRPEDENEKFTWYWLCSGIRSGIKDKFSKKEYIWSDEELEDFEGDTTVDKILNFIRNDKAEYFKIGERGLFNKRKVLVHNKTDEYESWNLEDIKRVNIMFCYVKQSMTVDEARQKLDVEEYAKMIKSLGLKGE